MTTALDKQLLSSWPIWHEQPFRLTCDEIENPHCILKDFFTWYSLTDIRLCLKEWLTDALRAEDVEALEYVTLRDNIEKLVEAAWVILMNENKKLTNIQAETAIETPIIPLNPDTEQLETDPLERIIDIIVKTTEAEKIFLLDAQGGDNAHHATQYDLLVLLPGKSQQAFKELQSTIESTCQGIATVLVRFSKAVETYRLIQEGHIFFSLHCNTENIIYDDGRVALPVCKTTDMATIKSKALATFNNNFRIAGLFLEGAKLYAEQQASDLAAFMLQQGAEHSLRAIIYGLTGHNYVTHNLQRLLQYVRQCAPEVFDAFPSRGEEDKRLLNLLYRAYVHSRYKNDFQIEEGDLQLLFQRVKHLHETTETVFNQKLDDLAFSRL
jgi:HEPN domain-containing protein